MLFGQQSTCKPAITETTIKQFSSSDNDIGPIFTAKQFYDACLDNSLHELLRPNLIIYLDASVDVAMKKISARGNEWDKNSPVYQNDSYLNDIYTTMKKEYLAKARYVLV